jgi:NMD protein affecting ribosome stability and mRNA decay
VKVCKRCGRVLQGKRWVRVSGEPEGDMVTCDDCGRHPDTHAAVLQVKGMKDEDLEKLIIEELEKSVKKGEVETVFKRKGKYHFTEKSMARSVARELKRRGADVLETTKIVTYDRQKSRQKTRITLRAVFHVAPGDVVKYHGEVYLVTRIDRGFLFTEEGKKIRLKEAKKVVGATRVEGIYISEKPPLVFVESTGETIDVPKKGKGRVEVIKSGSKTWTLPL